MHASSMDIQIHEGVMHEQCSVLYRKDVRDEVKKLSGATSADLETFKQTLCEKRIAWYQKNRVVLGLNGGVGKRKMDIKKVIDFEINFPSKFADVVERPYGKLFYNLDNSISHDSNHAVITDLNCDLDQALSDIESFYHEKGMSPRIYPAFLHGEEEILKPFLANNGFIYQKYDNHYFLWQEESKIIPNNILKIKRLFKIDDEIIEIIRSEDQGDWTINVLKRNIQAESFHLLAGYVRGKAVAIASLNMTKGLSRVDDVITHKNYRGQGFCSALIHYLVDYHRRSSENLLYLYSAEPKAIKIYRKAGFVEFKEQLSSWSAWLE